MAIIVKSTDPKGVISTLKSEIKNGSAHTWILEAYATEPKQFFTHTGEGNRFLRLAWFAPFAFADEVVFGLYARRGVAVDFGIWGVYHGRFIELLLNHGGTTISDIEIRYVNKVDVKRKTKPKPVMEAATEPMGKEFDGAAALRKILDKYKL